MSCDKGRVRNDQESCNLAITRSRAERKGLYGLKGKNVEVGLFLA